MNRRQFTSAGAIAAMAPKMVCAHHGWSSFDETQPIYLEGVFKTIKWQNPHAEAQIEINHRAMPQTAVALEVPKQQANVDATAVIAKARPPARKDKLWTIEFAPISRMQAWKFQEPKVGDSVSVVGYTFKDEKGSPTLRVEFWIQGGKAVPLRSAPA